MKVEKSIIGLLFHFFTITAFLSESASFPSKGTTPVSFCETSFNAKSLCFAEDCWESKGNSLLLTFPNFLVLLTFEESWLPFSNKNFSPFSITFHFELFFKFKI